MHSVPMWANAVISCHVVLGSVGTEPVQFLFEAVCTMEISSENVARNSDAVI